MKPRRYFNRLVVLSILCVLITALGCSTPSTQTRSSRVSWSPPPGAQLVTEQGWIEMFVAKSRRAIQLHAKDKVYWVGKTPNCVFIPAEDASGGMVRWHFGKDHEYVVKGYVGKPVAIGPLGTHPLLNAVEFNRLK
jgi:hypothetical protein